MVDVELDEVDGVVHVGQAGGGPTAGAFLDHVDELGPGFFGVFVLYALGVFGDGAEQDAYGCVGASFA